jgi:hypothetical protein
LLKATETSAAPSSVTVVNVGAGGVSDGHRNTVSGRTRAAAFEECVMSRL